MNALVALLVRVVRVKEGERESDSDARGGESRICRNSRPPVGKALHGNLYYREREGEKSGVVKSQIFCDSLLPQFGLTCIPGSYLDDLNAPICVTHQVAFEKFKQ